MQNVRPVVAFLEYGATGEGTGQLLNPCCMNKLVFGAMIGT